MWLKIVNEFHTIVIRVNNYIVSVFCANVVGKNNTLNSPIESYELTALNSLLKF